VFVSFVWMRNFGIQTAEGCLYRFLPRTRLQVAWCHLSDRLCYMLTENTLRVSDEWVLWAEKRE
jgi:hypothetical protein